MKAPSGRWSHLPSQISSKLRIVSSSGVTSPGLPVNDLGHEERLRQEPLDAAGPVHDQLVLFAQFVDAEDGDDVLQFAVPLQDRLHAAGDGVVLLADVLRVENAAVRRQRVDGRVDALLGDRPLQVDERVEVRNAVAGAGSVGSSAGTYTACTDVMAPLFVEVIRSCSSPISVASVGW